MGTLGNPKGTDHGPWSPAPDVDQLRMAAASWCAGGSGDPLSNGRFLSMFAVYLVKHFRAEEDRLDRAKAPDRVWPRQEHRRLVKQLPELLADMELGLDVTRGIHGFLDAWRLHQESVSLRADPTGLLDH